MIKPFIRWAGGKQNLIQKLLSHAPPDNLINRYFEPFLGAGSLFFANGFDDATISDVNLQLINAYEKIRTSYKTIHRLLREYESYFFANSNFYYRIREDYNSNLEKLNCIQAARFIFLVHTNYNGMYRINQMGKYNVPIGKLRPCIPTLEHLRMVSEKLTGKIIRHQSYQAILNQVEENDFIYLDPPYPPLDWDQHQQQFTVDKFKREDQEELASFATELWSKGCYVMISNSDVPLIRELYEPWIIDELETTRWVTCLSNRKKINELIIKNY
jgi:DNA adenine methylase